MSFIGRKSSAKDHLALRTVSMVHGLPTSAFSTAFARIGVGLALVSNALIGKAAALRAVELVAPRSVIGKNTVESLQSGAGFGFASQIDGMVERFRAELGGCTVVATGGLAPLIAPAATTIEHIEPFLTLHGLRIVFHRNQEH